jgi:sec-independent protein translocase protein TatB
VARTVGTLLGKAQRYVSDVKAEVNRSMELDELKKMKETVESAARDVEQTIQTSAPTSRKQWSETTAGLSCGQPGLRPGSRRHPSTSIPARRNGGSSRAPRRSGTRRATASGPGRCPGAARVARYRPQKFN